MKVIDLLNKKENGEKVPLIIKYNYEKYYFNGANYFTKPAGFGGHVLNIKFSNLNDEIEIIEPVVEEDKSTPNHPVSISEQFENLGYAINKAQKCFAKGWNTANEEEKTIEKIEYYDDSIAWVIDCAGQLSDIDKIAIDKINELIDEINKLKEQK